MVDHVTPETQSRNMSRIRGKDSLPEMRVRKVVLSLGCRFRLHRRDLPRTPDLVFPGRRKVIFVHGCFWQQHDCPRGSRPASNTEFWNTKLSRNMERDRNNLAARAADGWSTMVVWECETKALADLALQIVDFLE